MGNGRRHTVWILLVACLLMQFACIVPHHHHAEVFCLHRDATACTADALCAGYLHHEDTSDEEECSGEGCVAYFCCSIPVRQMQHLFPEYSFHYILYALACTGCVISAPGGNAESYGMHAGSLYTCSFISGTALRAPPMC